MSTSETMGHNEVCDRQSLVASNRAQPTIALLPCCDTFEDFFDTIGVSLETFCNELTGGWMFNYIDALQLAGVRTVLFFFSTRFSETVRLTHAATGATVCVLPTSRIYRAYRATRRQAVNVSGGSLKGVGDVGSDRDTRSSLAVAAKDVIKTFGSYLSTPLGSFARELRREGCDAILCQDYEYARFDVCVLLGKLMRLPAIATFQGGDRLPSLIEYPLRWLTLRASAGLIVAPQSERQRLKSFYGMSPAKVARIFNPMNVAGWRAIDRNEARSILNIPSDAQVVVYHGRIQIWQKGLDILLAAWEQICRERPDRDLRLLLVGTGNDADELRQRIAAMQLKGVIWVDEYVRDRSAIQRYLSAADVYTLPSRKEGFPVAPIEAMACGLPVVAADVAGISDIFEAGEANGGLVVPREDANALALALGHVLDREDWGRELGRRAWHRAAEDFSLQAIGEQLRDFLLKEVPSMEVKS